jgi:hypothetical protein
MMKSGDLYPSYSGLSAVETDAQLMEVLGTGTPSPSLSPPKIGIFGGEEIAMMTESLPQFQNRNFWGEE